MAGGGFNTFHGMDQGPPPPGLAGGYQGYYGQTPQYQYQPLYMPLQHQFTPYGQPNFGQFPAGSPGLDGGFPGIKFHNASGTIGVPIGYNYLFPQEHCSIHVFTGDIPPWQQPLYLDQTNHVKFAVPSIITIKELMQQLGCDNPEAKKNILYEINEGGNGIWKRGLMISGDQKDRVKKQIKEMGWDGSRGGLHGKRPVVWLWVQKK